MQITHLSLTNFRNYGRLELALPTGPILLYGQNAQGKTNILEAIYYLATTRSPFADSDQQLITWDALQSGDPVVVGRLTATVQRADGENQLEMRLICEQKQSLRQSGYSFRREALVNRRRVRLMDLLGHLRVVMFLPEDIQLITGSPSERRRYLDITLCQIDPIYCRRLSQYNKTLEQRNALLRQLAEGSGSREMLQIFAEKLADAGGYIFLKRANLLHKLGRIAQHIYYETLTEGRESLRITYLPRLESQRNGRPATDELTALGKWLQDDKPDQAAITTRFAQALAASQTHDMARGATTLGPHRDDWTFSVNRRELSRFGSRGQQRSAILALKLAEINWMTAETGDKPILLLDEVVAELDETRRTSLLSAIDAASQALLTATEPAMFTNTFLERALCLQVKNGQISQNQNLGL